MKENLKKAIELVQNRTGPLAAVFDLDSTLFCMKYRTEAIIKEFIKKNIHNLPSEIISKTKSLKVTERDWSVEEILSRYDIAPEDPVVKAIHKFWRKCFFTNDFLYLDHPYTGSPEYVWHLKNLGACIFYLTGRNQKKMAEGSLVSLKKWGFPLANLSHLILKKDMDMEDSSYKVKELKQIQNKFKTVLFFENEPVILNTVALKLSQIKLFWIDSTHSRKQLPIKQALPIPMDYRL